MKQENSMQGLVPDSDEFMFWDPEQVDVYFGWQKFSPVVNNDNNRVTVSEQQESKRALDTVKNSAE